MKNLLGIIAIVFVMSCNDGMEFEGTVTWEWNKINDNAQAAILSSGVDTSKVIVWGNLTPDQKNTFLSLGLDSTKRYKITQ